MSLRPLLPAFFLCALVLAWPHAAQAQVRHCVTASGQTIFTDRHCEEVGAVERIPPSTEGAPGAQLHRGCARTVQDLAYEMRNAIDTHDANHLAALYHWPGTSADEGFRIWTQLDAIANRPLVDIVPVMPTTPAPGQTTSGDAAESTGAAPADGTLYPQTTVRRDPVGLRVEQTLRDSATPSQTVFGLTHYFGCWWVRY
jgi:hypothetical protein